MSAVALLHVSKTYRSAKLTVPVLNDISFSVDSGQSLAIMGPSGSGKSTLMNLLGLLDRPSSGSLELADEQVALSMSDRQLARLRSERIGFVFQSFNLLPRLSALANVLMPTAYVRGGKTATAKTLLSRLGLGERMDHLPAELSGGERQRVAIARALVNNPQIVLADEPTGNLDSKAGSEVMDILVSLAKEGKTVVVITHDPDVASRCDKIIHIRDGAIQE
jgi:putative ABC transport system ATP-binding protein